jgi:5-deoxy-glucuronate isomerase
MTPTATHLWHRPAGTAAGGAGEAVAIRPDDAGWTYTGLAVGTIPAGAAHEFATAGVEMAVLPLAGSVRVEVESRRFDLRGRESVFDRVTDWAYLPIDAEVRLTATEGPAEVALPSAVGTRRFDPAYGPAEDVAIEIRGAGPATRQVNNFMSPETFDGADKLMCVELLTPDGNWSSYPPHRHDDSPECPVNNEEIYYFRIAGSGGFGLHRTYTPDGAVDVNVRVADGDVFLIPRGYHGPCVAAPGYPMYYLNVLAGPGAERSMAFCDDPAHHWVRETWATMAPDPRCPMTTAAGPVPPR